MNAVICFRTIDEVNAALVDQWCDEQGLTFRLTDPRDPLFPADVNGLLIDLDYLWLRPCERVDVLESLAMRLLPYPVAVSIYDLDDCVKETVEARGILLAPRIDEKLISQVGGSHRAGP